MGVDKQVYRPIA